MRPWVLLQLGAITAAVWLLEGARVLFVIQALNLPAVARPGDQRRDLRGAGVRRC